MNEVDSINESSPDDEAEEEGELFRREVLEEMGNKLVGDVILVAPPGWTTLILFYGALVFFSVMVLLFGQYQRKERVPGVLIPNQGLPSVVAERDGQISELTCQEGEWVSQGQALIKISRELFLDNKKGKYEVQLDELRIEQNRLESQRMELEDRWRINRENLEVRQQALIDTDKHIADVIRLKKKQLTEAEKTLASATKLVHKNIISQTEYDQQLTLFTNIRQALAEEQKKKTDILTSLKEISFQREKGASDFRLASDELELRLSTGRNRLVELESEKEIIVKAPADGFVSGLRLAAGQTVQKGQAMLTLVPKELKLEGNLFVSSRAAPFIREGQSVWLQFESLPPLRYGVFPGTVITVSRAALRPEEVKDIKLDAPRYLVKVALNAIDLSVYQKELALKAGLQLEADILLDRRSLWEWILDPLLRGRGPQ